MAQHAGSSAGAQNDDSPGLAASVATVSPVAHLAAPHRRVAASGSYSGGASLRVSLSAVTPAVTSSRMASSSESATRSSMQACEAPR